MFVEYVVAGYGISAIVLAAYVGWTLRRGRALSRQVPADRRRFLRD